MDARLAPPAPSPLADAAALSAAADGLLEKARFTLQATRSQENNGLRPIQEPERTLDGERATELVCWHYVRGEGECACGGTRAHICQLACGGAINAALGGKHVCKNKKCGKWHPEAAQVRAELDSWWRAARGREPTWSFAAIEAPAGANSACKGGSRSSSSSAAASTAAGASGAADGAGTAEPEGAAGAPPRPCTVPAEVQLERIRRHATASAHIRTFLSEPFLDAWLADEALRPVLSMRKCAKELSEAYGAAGKVIALLRAHGAAEGGAGVTILDVCCGKGLTALLLSYLLPSATLLLFDANGAMDLAHVAARPQMSFAQLDLFSAEALGVLDAAAAATCARHTVAIGTHLCGALSPRLLDLAIRAQAIHALVLSPCCLRGALGAGVARAAKAAWPGCENGPYHVLVATLAALGQSEAHQASVAVEYDDAVLSPKNAFVVVSKRAPELARMGGGVSMHVCVEAEEEDAPRDQ